jgi:hypothetical protein
MKFSGRFVMFHQTRELWGGSMKLRLLSSFSIVACLLIAIAALAQTDPVSGTWTGDWGPSAGDRNRVTIDLKWDGKALSGGVTAGDNVTAPIPLTKTTFDPKTGTIHMEADASGRRGAVHYTIDGKVEKGAMTGTWTHDGRKGDFKLAKK